MADTQEKASSYQELRDAVAAGVEAALVGLVIALIFVLLLNLGRAPFGRGTFSPQSLLRIAGTSIVAGLLAGRWLKERGVHAGHLTLTAGAIAGAPSGYVYGAMGHLVRTFLNPAYGQFRQQLGLERTAAQLVQLILALVGHGPIASLMGAFAGAGAALLYMDLIAPMLLGEQDVSIEEIKAAPDPSTESSAERPERPDSEPDRDRGTER